MDLDRTELLKYLNDLKVLKNSPEFSRFMYGNFQGIEHLQEQLLLTEATDSVRIARLQGELQHMTKLQREYEDCEKLIFSLASTNKPAINRHIESGIVPPRQD